MYWKYNSFFDLKTKRILKIFHFSFLNFKTRVEKWMNFLKFIFWFQIKKSIRKFWFLFFEIGFKSKQIQKNFFSFFIFQFNFQIWKMKDTFWNLFFHFKSKNWFQSFEVFVFWFEMGLTKVCFDRWVLKQS